MTLSSNHLQGLLRRFTVSEFPETPSPKRKIDEVKRVLICVSRCRRTALELVNYFLEGGFSEKSETVDLCMIAAELQDLRCFDEIVRL